MRAWTYDGAHLYSGFMAMGRLTFKDYSGISAHTFYEPDWRHIWFLRGGPTMRIPSDINYEVNYFTDSRKKLYGVIEYSGEYGWHDYMKKTGIGASVGYKPLDNVFIELKGKHSWGFSELQYVDTYKASTGEDVYLLGRIDQTNTRISARINVGITPDMSIQYYMQPFMFTGKYSKFKRLLDSSVDEYKDRFYQYTSENLGYNMQTENIDPMLIMME